ncbi:MAG TPA: hypothetical protein VF253_14390 [Candidatus Limnocylindrales bacterium]
MTRRLVLVLAALVSLAACDAVPPMLIAGNPSVECGAFEGPDCNDLLEIGLNAIAGTRREEPLAIAVDRACPPNARCVPSSLGGDTAAFVVHWSDGSVQWATIPLPADWPASPPGEAVVGSGPPPEHILSLVGPGPGFAP